MFILIWLKALCVEWKIIIYTDQLIYRIMILLHSGIFLFWTYSLTNSKSSKVEISNQLKWKSKNQFYFIVYLVTDI